MKTKLKVVENSVAVAMTEIDRLERGRASFASAKRAAGERLGQQGRELGELRRRLLAERPRAWARSNREHARRRERLEHERRREAARAEAEHRERLAVYTAELEAKRQQLAELAAAPVIERPGRRMLEWAVPAAATVLVAFFAILAVGEEDAVTHAAADTQTLASPVADMEPGSPVGVEAEPEVGEPEPLAVAPEPAQPEPVQVEPVKPIKTPKKPSKNPKLPPLTLDPTGDPLG
jgi:hypothetical protein